ncbi:sulfur carrier protein ThiS [Ruminococcus sp.]|uniref:sulfur carrier protein ThiS n=1 Tax=Ruminococcus sp. TaxID=41978 RepID=UPI0025F33F84|nr:sulfur carrier protein ThiS [Ruminococcus sp.]
MMHVNGKEFSLNNPQTLLEFLQKQGYQIQRIAIERNGEIVPKADYATIQLSDSDVIEVVAFMGGG